MKKIKKKILIYLSALFLLTTFLTYMSSSFKMKINASDEFKVNTKTYNLDGFTETWGDSMVLTFDSTLLSENKSIKLWISDVFGTGGVIRWGDGDETNLQKNKTFYTHDYGVNANGEYIIEISNNFEHFGSIFPPNVNSANLNGLVAVHRFNDNIKSLRNGFIRAYNLVKVPEKLPANVTNLMGMFEEAWSFNQELKWDLENVTTTQNMFKNAKEFNQPLNLTNTSSVTSVISMFEGAEKFNQSLNFDTLNVTSMNLMFKNAKEFNQPLNFTSTSNVTYMSSMFEGTEKFNQLLNFDTSKVINMTSMFKNAKEFNSQLNFTSTSNVTSMASMFEGTEKFNQKLTFDILKVSSMQAMFKDAKEFNGELSFSNNESGNLKNTNSMFWNALEFNQPVNFNTSNVTNMSSMFQGTEKFNQPLDFDTSKVTTMAFMFKDTFSFNQDLQFDLSSVSSTAYMFENAKKFNGKINFTNSNKILWLTNMFKDAISFNQQISLDTTSAQIMTGMFENALSFNGTINFTNTANVVAMERMFYETNSFNQDLSNLNFGNVTHFKEMLYNSKISNQNYNKLIEKIANDKREKNVYQFPSVRYNNFSNRKRYVERIDDFTKLYEYGYDFDDAGIYKIKIKAIASYDKTGLVKNSDIIGLDTQEEKNELLNDIKYEIITEGSKKYLKIAEIENNKYKIEYENSLPLKEIIDLKNLELEAYEFVYNGDSFELKFKNLPEHVNAEFLTSKTESAVGQYTAKIKFSTDESLYHIINHEKSESISWKIIKTQETAPEDEPTPNNPSENDSTPKNPSENDNNKKEVKTNEIELQKLIIIIIEIVMIISLGALIFYLLKRRNQ